MSRPIFFTHVMKTGGTSLGLTVERAVGNEPKFPHDATVNVAAAKAIPGYLMEEPAGRRREYALISVHHPAWVAFRAVDDCVRATVLRDPLERTLSHLKQLAAGPHPAETTEDAWRDPEIRSRMTNYMCQIFSDPGEAAEPHSPLNADDPDIRAALRQAMANGWETAIWHPRSIDNAAEATAIATLARYDVVGVTNDLESFTERLAVASNRRIESPGRMNQARIDGPPAPWLAAEIKEATRHDYALYDHARTLSLS
jgi:hypothetical protein